MLVNKVPSKIWHVKNRTRPSSCPESGRVIPHFPCLPKVCQDVVIEDQEPSEGRYVPARNSFAMLLKELGTDKIRRIRDVGEGL